ncbi:hypothetical protein EVAR_40079_1 [Eumeta japonica]|uniref:Uncharacterized protein n=1 Tax=Eumeta variegata TaxID=151549 RepID=A0A4C1X1J6_EUMVA|nr:hypothetical protein EVAR_40079_1 [Eumeta japonica]
MSLDVRRWLQASAGVSSIMLISLSVLMSELQFLNKTRTRENFLFCVSENETRLEQPRSEDETGYDYMRRKSKYGNRNDIATTNISLLNRADLR